MAKFTDRFDRTWTLEITVQDIKEVRTALGIDLFDAFAGDYGVYSDVVSDVEKLVAVAYVLCKGQITKVGITEEDFGRGMAGDALRSLGDAFGEALVDFFPNARARDVVRATLSKARELVDLRTAVLADLVGQLDVASLVADTEEWVYRCAGILGIAPGPFTLRELHLMAESRRQHDWDQTAEVLAMLFNGLFRPETARTAADFDPTVPSPAPEPVMEVPLSALKVLVPELSGGGAGGAHG